MSTNDLQFTWRTLKRAPVFAVVTILTIAIGIGATTAIVSAVDAVLLQPLPYQQPGQLVRLYQADRRHLDDRLFVSPVHYLALRTRMATFASIAALYTYDESGADIGTGEAARRIHVLPVSADYFDVARVAPVLGRGFRVAEEDGSDRVILSNDLWVRQFAGDASAVGRAINLNGRPYAIVGVMPAGYRDPIAGSVDAWTVLDLREGKDPHNFDNHYLSIIARLRPGISLTQAQAELDLLMARLAVEYARTSNPRNVARLYPLHEDVVGSARQSLMLMLGAASLVLLLVCVNVASLLLVRSSERAGEFALRSALGASRSRLLRQMLVESLALAGAGGVAGLLVALGVMAAIVAVASGSVPRIETLHVDSRLLIIALGIATLSAVGFGIGPAWRTARADPRDVLQEYGRSQSGGASRMRARQWLVVAQVALAFVLLSGAGVLLMSFHRLRQVDLGIRTDDVLTYELHLPDARYDSTRRARLFEDLAVQVEALPGVRAAGGISKLPSTGAYNSWGVTALTGPLANTPRENIEGENRVIAGDYLKAVGIPVIDGRAFDARDDVAAPHRVLVSQSLARELFPGTRAVGQRLNTGNLDAEIIGLVGDVSLDAEGRPGAFVYHAHRQFAGDRNWALTQVVLASSEPERLVTDIRWVVAALDPQLVVYKPMRFADVIGRGEAQRLFTTRMLTTFAGVALALAALGLFGVLSYGVRMRSREFGIRMALGADAGAVRRMVLREAFTVTAIGVTLGIVGAVAMSRVIASAAFHTAALEPLVLAGAIVFIGAVAALAAYAPARRATTVDPRSTLQ